MDAIRCATIREADGRRGEQPDRRHDDQPAMKRQSAAAV